MRYLLIVLILIKFSFAITLEEVIKLAKQNSLQIKLNMQDLKKVEAQIQEVKSNLYPQIILQANYQKVDKGYITGLSLTNRYNAKIELSQRIFDKSVFDSLKIAKENIKLQKLIKEDITLQIVDTAKRLYLNSVYYKNILDKKEETLKYWKENYQFIKQQYEVGLTNRFNLYRAKAQYELSKADVEKAKSDYQKSLIKLKRYLYLDTITPPEDNIKIFYESIPEKSQILENPKLKIIQETAIIKQKEASFYNANKYPKLNVNLAYEIYRTRDFPSLEEVWRKGYIITLSANWLLYDGNNTNSKVLQKNIEKIQEEIKYKEKLNQLNQEYEESLIELKSLVKQIKAYEENIIASKEALDYATQRYKQGLTNIIEVLEAQKNFEEAKIQYINAIYQINIKIFDINLIVGKQ